MRKQRRSGLRNVQLFHLGAVLFFFLLLQGGISIMRGCRCRIVTVTMIVLVLGTILTMEAGVSGIGIWAGRTNGTCVSGLLFIVASIGLDGILV